MKEIRSPGRKSLIDNYRDDICTILWYNPKASVSVIHNELLKKEMEKTKLTQAQITDLSYKKPIPGPSAIDKYIREKEIKKTILEWRKAVKPIDQEWSIGRCNRYHIPAHSLPRIIAINNELKEYDRFLTIRCAKYIALLDSVLPELSNLKLTQIAALYARQEQIAESSMPPVNGIVDFNSNNLDDIIFTQQDTSDATVNKLTVEMFSSDVAEEGAGKANLIQKGE